MQNTAENKSSMSGLLESIRQWPAMYLGRKSVHDLHIWLQGLQTGLALSGDFENDVDFSAFDQFVQDKYNWHDVGGWAGKIAYHRRDEAIALDRFFELYDEFRDQQQSKAQHI